VVYTEEAEELPVEAYGEIEAEPIEKKEEKVKKEKKAPEPPPEEDFDRRDAQRAIFATLKDAGIANKDRKAWAEKHDLATSTDDWSKADFARAMGICIDPVKEQVMDAIEVLGLDLGDVSLRVLGQEEPKFLKHWNLLAEDLEEKMEGGDL